MGRPWPKEKVKDPDQIVDAKILDFSETCSGVIMHSTSFFLVV